MCQLPPGSQLLVSAQQISRRVAELGRELSPLMQDNAPWLVIGVLRGAFIFMADLVRNLSVPVHIDFIQVSSYGNAAFSSGGVELLSAPRMAVKGRSLLLLDDVLDTGNSLQWLVNYFVNQGAAQVLSCVLLDKPDCRKTAINADFVGFSLSTGYVVGYGLDMAQDYRQLPGVYQLPEDKNIC